MRPGPFAELARDLLVAAHHPAIAAVHTTADAGLSTPPCGLVVTLVDGWRLILQVARTSPAGGDSDLPPTPPAVARQVLPPTSGNAAEPALKGTRLLDGLAGILTKAGRVELGTADVAMSDRYTTQRPRLRVACTDGGTLYVTVVAVIPPAKALDVAPLHAVADNLL